MTETTSETEPGGPPPVREFDPAAGAVPPLAADGAATLVVLLAGDARREWAAEAALELSAAWAREGRRVVLADLHLETPLLHEPAGVDNLEGVVDVFLYGASIARSARPVPGRGFYLIPAGTYEPDAEAIYRHPRWPKLVAGFRDASATLVLFAPTETAELDAIAAWIDRVFLLGSPRGGTLERLATRGLRPEATLVPPGARAPELAEPPVPARAGSADRELTIPPAPPRARRSKRRGLGVAVGVVIAAAALAAAGFYLARERPDLVPWGAAPTEPSLPEMSSVAPDGPSRTGSPLPVSVQVVAYQTLPAAAEQASRLRSAFPGLPVFVSPEDVQGVAYYKIMAGALRDTAAARALRERMVAEGAIEEEDAVGSWSLLQNAPFAFDLGERPDSAAAAAAVDSLGRREVPAYALPIPYSDGSRRWQLYAGAYRDSASAEAMRQRLAAAGAPTRLVARIGQPTAATR